MYFGNQIEWFEELPSTLDIAAAKGREGAPEGLVIIAERQTAGRGRLGRTWASPKGGVWLSLLLRPDLPPAALGLLSICFGVAAAATISRMTQLPVKLKWPNDLLINEKKLAGLLIESSITSGKVDFAALGLGININIKPEDFPEELRKIATSLLIETGEHWSCRQFVKLFLEQAETSYNQLLAGQEQAILQAWSELDAGIGRQVTGLSEGQKISGEACGLDEQGGLRVKTSSGMRIISQGEVAWR
jgi:BirA family biotin operon repressor/biotin-[acetyl-CoA-carboxylase] ligase